MVYEAQTHNRLVVSKSSKICADLKYRVSLQIKSRLKTMVNVKDPRHNTTTNPPRLHYMWDTQNAGHLYGAVEQCCTVSSIITEADVLDDSLNQLTNPSQGDTHIDVYLESTQAAFNINKELNGGTAAITEQTAVRYAIKGLNRHYTKHFEDMKMFDMQHAEDIANGKITKLYPTSWTELIDAISQSKPYEEEIKLLSMAKPTKTTVNYASKETPKRNSKQSGEKPKSNAKSTGDECPHCHNPGHTKAQCWDLHPELNPFKRKDSESKYHNHNMFLLSRQGEKTDE